LFLCCHLFEKIVTEVLIFLVKMLKLRILQQLVVKR
jgi:hypothetical protein